MRASTIKSKCGVIFYKVGGLESGPVIVFVHGVAMDHGTFNEQVEFFKDRYRILVWDLPAHGLSGIEKHDRRYTIIAAEVLHELLLELQMLRAVFVGQSMGSLIVQHFWVKHPEMVIATAHVPGIQLKSFFGSWLKLLIPIIIAPYHLIPAKWFYKAFGKHRAVRKDV